MVLIWPGRLTYNLCVITLEAIHSWRSGGFVDESYALTDKLVVPTSETIAQGDQNLFELDIKVDSLKI